MPIRIDEMVVEQGQKQLNQQADTNIQLAAINDTLVLILEELRRLEDAIRSAAFVNIPR